MGEIQNQYQLQKYIVMNNRYIKIVLLGLIIPIILTSCQIVNRYKSPEVNVEDLFRDKVESDTTTIANIPWREYFKDPLLQALIDEGLSNNHDMLITTTRIRQAEAALGMARAAYFPNVALVGNVEQKRYSMGQSGKDVLGYHQETYSLGVAVSWEADIWGKLNRQSRARYAQFLASHSYRNLVQTSLISNIATSYYSLLALDEQLRVIKETIELLKESTTTMEAMKESGMLNAAAVEQSKAMLYNTQINIPDIESRIRQLENSLCMMLGRKLGNIERLGFANQNVPNSLNYGVPVQMLAKRPDVQQAELGFRAAFELKNAAQASFYPSITLSSGMIGYGAASLSGFFKAENIFANIVGGLTQPLFARKQLTANLKITKAQQEEALLNFEKSVLNASREVSDILFGSESSLKKNETRKQQVQSLLNAVDFTQELLKAGEANYIEVLNAEQSLLQAQLGQVSDKLEQLQYGVSLYRALGGGIE